MGKKTIIMIVIFFIIFAFLFSQELEDVSRSEANKKLFIYFMNEEAGYEEYEWIEQADKYVLSAKGEMTKPISLITELMTIEVDKEFKPLRFYFRGIVNGVNQEVEAAVSQGEVKINVKAAGQTKDMEATISSDALFLPNGFFSPYVFLAKRVKESIREKISLPAYIVPQIEISLEVEPDSENESLLHLIMAGIKIELHTDEKGYIKSLSIPSQKIEVNKERFKKEEPTKREEGIAHEMHIRGNKLGKGFYNLQEIGEDILIRGETKQVLGPVSFDFQFEEKLSSNWNLKEAFLKGKGKRF